jgi:hypothetical protein
MEPQNYANHARFVKGYHFLLTALLTIGLIVSIINLCRHWNESGRAINLMLILIVVCLFLIGWFMRVFALKAQDRAIRAEESLRYFILTGKAIDSRLTIGQIIALRFADDAEFIALTEKAATENLSPVDIKKAIQNWRADHHRA